MSSAPVKKTKTRDKLPISDPTCPKEDIVRRPMTFEESQTEMDWLVQSDQKELENAPKMSIEDVKRMCDELDRKIKEIDINEDLVEEDEGEDSEDAEDDREKLKIEVAKNPRHGVVEIKITKNPYTLSFGDDFITLSTGEFEELGRRFDEIRRSIQNIDPSFGVRPAGDI
jgi:hypothetical protein